MENTIEKIDYRAILVTLNIAEDSDPGGHGLSAPL